MELYLNTYGTYLYKTGEMFIVKIEDEKHRVSPKRVSSIIISSAATISTDAIQLALEYNIDILFLDKYGDPYGRIWFPKLGSTTLIRRKLLEVYTNDKGIEFVKEWTCRKIQNQIDFISLLMTKRPNVEHDFDDELNKMLEYKEIIEDMSGSVSEHSNSIMGYEGNVSRNYYKIISTLLPDKYQFLGRSSRPAKDPFNAFLNYGYGILYGKVERALVIAGLDPYIGLLHTDNYNKKSLVFDFIEPYRIFIDRTVFYLFSRRKVQDNHWDKIKDGVTLNADGKKFFVPEVMETFDKVIRYRNSNMKTIAQIQADAHFFANVLIGKNPKSTQHSPGANAKSET